MARRQEWSRLSTLVAGLFFLGFLSLENRSENKLSNKFSTRAASRQVIKPSFGWKSNPRSCRNTRRAFAKRFDEDEGAAEVWRLLQRDRNDFKKLFNEEEETIVDRPEYELIDTPDEDEKKRLIEGTSFRALEGEIAEPVSAASLMKDNAAKVSKEKAASPVATAASINPTEASPPKSPFADSAPVSPFADSAPVSPFADSAPVSPFADSAPVSPFADSTPVSPFADPSKSPFTDSSPKSPFADDTAPVLDNDNPFKKLEKRSQVEPGFPTAAEPSAQAPDNSIKFQLPDSSTPWYKTGTFQIVAIFGGITAAMLATTATVFKLGGVHYDDFS